MDIQSAAAQLVKALGNNPELVSQFANHPYSTTAQVTGTDERISKADMSQVLAQVAAQVSNQKLGSADTASVASQMLGQTGGSVHSLASALFGGAGSGASTPAGAPSTAEIIAKSVAGGLAARGMAALLTNALGANKKPNQPTQQ